MNAICNGCSLNTSATTTRTARILGCGRERRTTEFAPLPPGGFFLRIDGAGCIIVKFGLPDPDQLLSGPYICMPDVPRSSPKEDLRASQSNTYLSPGSLFNPRHKRNRSIFYADEILARHRGYRPTRRDFSAESFCAFCNYPRGRRSYGSQA